MELPPGGAIAGRNPVRLTECGGRSWLASKSCSCRAIFPACSPDSPTTPSCALTISRNSAAKSRSKTLPRSQQTSEGPSSAQRVSCSDRRYRQLLGRRMRSGCDRCQDDRPRCGDLGDARLQDRGVGGGLQHQRGRLAERVGADLSTSFPVFNHALGFPVQCLVVSPASADAVVSAQRANYGEVVLAMNGIIRALTSVTLATAPLLLTSRQNILY